MNATIAHINSILKAEVYHLQDDQIVIDKIYFDTRVMLQSASKLFLDLTDRPNQSASNQLDAIQKDCALIISKHKHAIDYQQTCLMVVDDVWKALHQWAIAHRNQIHFPIIGITGSNGKTIVKEWLATLLANHHPCKSPTSYNSQLGVPLSVLQLSEYHEVGIFEAGISQVGEMQNLQAIIQPTIGILTNIGDAHDAGFANRQQKLIEKLKLFEQCPVLIFKSSEQVNLEVVKKHFHQKIIDWSFDESHPLHVSYHIAKSSAAITFHGIHEETFTIPFTSVTAIENATNAILAAKEYGITTAEIQTQLSKLQPVSMRMELKSGKNNCLLLNDSYNADLVSLHASLEFAFSQKENRAVHLVLSDFGELHPMYEEEMWQIIEGYPVEQISYIGEKSFQNKNIAIQHFPNVQRLMEEWQTNPPSNQLILVKGARKFGLEKIIDGYTQLVHRTEMKIHLNNINHNIKSYKKLLQPNTKMMAVIKAGAYGSDSIPIGKFLANKMDYLAVAYIDEGIRLRNSGIELPIMVMNPDLEAYNLMERYQLEPEIISVNQLQKLKEKAGDKALKIHLKFDTGMHRVGIMPFEIQNVVNILNETPWKLTSVFTHFHSADDVEADTLTREQYSLFTETCNRLEKLGQKGFMKHCCNTTAISRFPEFHGDMVRLGIGMYGLTGDKNFVKTLTEVHTWTSYISQIKNIPSGSGIGYNHRFESNKEMKIAVVNIGYADGLPRRLSGTDFSIYIQNKACKVLGNISMDSCVIDISHLDHVSAGDQVIICDQSTQSISTIASLAGMIPYELLCQVGPRVRRSYVSE